MNEPIHIPITEKEIKQALKQALSSNFIDNLRNRHPNVVLDSKLRGYVGELAFRKWARSNEIEFNKSNIKNHSSGMDIDFIYETPENKIHLELKTSLIPDADQEIEQVIRQRDIKLIRRNNKSIEELEADIHVQIIFKQLRLRKDDWLQKQNINLESPIDSLYEELAAFRYTTDTFLVAWIDKLTLIEQINAKPKHLKKWKYGKREFWCCNLEKDAKKPLDLIHYLKQLK